MSQVNPYSVQRFRGGFAIVWFEDGKRHRRTLYSSNRASAEAEARIVWARADATPWNVGRIVNGYIDDFAKENPPSLQRRRDAWKAMRVFWEDVDPSQIDEDMCRDYYEEREVADATLRYELLMLSTALNWALKKKHITSRPQLWLPPKGEYRVRYLSETEFEKFYQAVRAPHARLYVLLGLNTLARPGAILDLKWRQVDFGRQQIELNPPGRKQTSKKRPIVPMNEPLREALMEAYEARQGSYVIERGAERLGSIKKAFQAASQRSGVKATPYTLRHTGAVRAAENGVSMAELAQFMGHDDDRTTQKYYARFSPGYLKGVGDAIARSRKRR